MISTGVGAVFIKAVTVGSEFNVVKYMKDKKGYMAKYNAWKKQRP